MSIVLPRPATIVPQVAVGGAFVGSGLALVAAPKLAILGPLLLVGVFAMSRPDMAFVGLLAAKPLFDYFVRKDLGGLSLGQAWGGALLLTAAAYVTTHHHELNRWGAYRVPLLMVAAYPLLTFARANPGNAPINELRLVSWLAVVYVIERIASTAKGQARVVRLGLVMALALSLVILLLHETNQYGRAYYASTRAFAQLDVMQPAGVSAFAVYCSALALVPLVAGRRTAASLILYAGLGAGVVLSLVRTSFFAFLLIFGGIVARGVYRRRGALVGAGLAVTGAMAAALIAYQHVISSRLVHASGRVSFWRPVLDGTLAHPISIFIGHGPTFSFSVIQQALNENIWSHNDFVDLFATGGIVLLLAYAGLVVWLVRSALALLRDPAQTAEARDVGYLALLVCGAYVVIALFNDAAFASPTIAVGVLLGLVRGMSNTPGTTWID